MQRRVALQLAAAAAADTDLVEGRQGNLVWTVQQQNCRNELVSMVVCGCERGAVFWPLCACVCRLLPGSTCAVAFRAQTSFVYMTRARLLSLGCCITSGHLWRARIHPVPLSLLHFGSCTHKQHAALQCLSAANRARPWCVLAAAVDPCTMRPFDNRPCVSRAGFWPVLVVGQVSLVPAWNELC